MNGRNDGVEVLALFATIFSVIGLVVDGMFIYSAVEKVFGHDATMLWLLITVMLGVIAFFGYYIIKDR